MSDSSRKPAGGRRLRIGVAFERFGPHHMARLEAAQGRADVVGIEVCGNSNIYHWQKVVAPSSFQRLTLFPDRTGETLTLSELRSAYRQFDRLQLDVMAVNGWAMKWALMQMEWSLGARVPMLMMSDTSDWDLRRKVWKEWIKGRLITLCSAALVAGQSQSAYLAKLGMPQDRISPGWDVVDNEHFARGAEEARGRGPELRSRHGLPEAYFFICARFISFKNLPTLLKAYARYRQLSAQSSGASRRAGEGRPPWGLVLAGDGPLKAEICRLIDELGIADFVVLAGFRGYDDLPVFYGLANALILGSTLETWGLVVNEAMAAGLPVLLSRRCGCAADLVVEGVNGFTMDPLDAEAWAASMLRLSSDPAAARRMGEKSREIISRWTLDTFAIGLTQAAEAALRRPVRPSLSSRMVLRASLSRLRWSIPSISPTETWLENPPPGSQPVA